MGWTTRKRRSFIPWFTNLRTIIPHIPVLPSISKSCWVRLWLNSRKNNIHRTFAFYCSSPRNKNNPNPFSTKNRFGLFFSGTPEGTRTPDLLIRSQSLYPTELLAHTHFSQMPEYSTTSLKKMQVLFSLFPTFLSSPLCRLDSFGVSGVKCPP